MKEKSLDIFSFDRNVISFFLSHIVPRLVEENNMEFYSLFNEVV